MKYLTAGESEAKDLFLLESMYNPASNNKTETIFAQCNGRMGIRGTHEIVCLNRKPQCYLAGFYHQASPDEPDELVNFPDLTAFRIAAGDIQLNLEDQSTLVDYKRSFNLGSGELVTTQVFKISQDLTIRLEFARFISFADKSLICQKLKIQVNGQNTPLTVRTGIDGQVSNEGVSHFRDLQFRVMRSVMLMQANCGHKTVLIQSAVHLSKESEKLVDRKDYRLSRRRIDCSLKLLAQAETTFEMVKLSRIILPGQLLETDDDLSRSVNGTIDDVSTGYERLLEESKRAVRQYQEDSLIQIEGLDLEERALIEYAQLQLIGLIPDQTAAHSIGAKGLTGEGYRGHVFWDTEIYLVPFYTNLSPKISKNLFQFRCNGLDGAKKKAQEYHFKGALYPWEVTDDGQEKTPLFAQMNIHTGKANPVWSSLKEHHISADIAYAMQKYVETTHDWDFMFEAAFPVIIETAAFWVSRASWDEKRKCLRILDVIGPDEYTEHVNDNAYTNFMAYENVKFALGLVKRISAATSASQWKQDYDLDELANLFQKFLKEIFLPEPDENHIIPQDETFFQKPLIGNLEKYINHPQKQAILMDYSRDEVVDSQVLKQADVVMLQTLLPEYFSQEVKKANLDYYEPKTLHDSSLSPSIHAIAYADVGNRSKAYQYFKKSMKIDINDHLVDSTDGLHAASLGGIWLALIRGFAGVFVTSGYLKVDPCMPSAWQRMCFYYRYLGNKLEFNITDREIHIRNVEPAVIQGNRTFWIKTSGKIHFFDQELSVPYDEGNDPDLQ